MAALFYSITTSTTRMTAYWSPLTLTLQPGKTKSFSVAVEVYSSQYPTTDTFIGQKYLEVRLRATANEAYTLDPIAILDATSTPEYLNRDYLIWIRFRLYTSDPTYDVQYTDMIGISIENTVTYLDSDEPDTVYKAVSYRPFGMWYATDGEAPEQSVSASLSGSDALATTFDRSVGINHWTLPGSSNRSLSVLAWQVCDMCGGHPFDEAHLGWPYTQDSSRSINFRINSESFTNERQYRLDWSDPSRKTFGEGDNVDTFRTVLGRVAGAGGGYAYVDLNGELLFGPGRYNSDYGDNVYPSKVPGHRVSNAKSIVPEIGPDAYTSLTYSSNSGFTPAFIRVGKAPSNVQDYERYYRVSIGDGVSAPDDMYGITEDELNDLYTIDMPDNPLLYTHYQWYEKQVQYDDDPNNGWATDVEVAKAFTPFFSGDWETVFEAASPYRCVTDGYAVKVDWVGDPNVSVGQYIHVRDTQGRLVPCFITDQHFEFSGGLTCKSESKVITLAENSSNVGAIGVAYSRSYNNLATGWDRIDALPVPVNGTSVNGLAAVNYMGPNASGSGTSFSVPNVPLTADDSYGYVASCDSRVDYAHSAYKAFDGNSGTYWQAATGSGKHWLKLKFQGDTLITAVRIYAADTDVAMGPTGIVLHEEAPTYRPGTSYDRTVTGVNANAKNGDLIARYMSSFACEELTFKFTGSNAPAIGKIELEGYLVRHVMDGHKLTINYVWSDTGDTAAPSVTMELGNGEFYSVASPVLLTEDGLPTRCSRTSVAGNMGTSDLTITVNYAPANLVAHTLASEGTWTASTDTNPYTGSMYTTGTAYKSSVSGIRVYVSSVHGSSYYANKMLDRTSGSHDLSTSWAAASGVATSASDSAVANTFIEIQFPSSVLNVQVTPYSRTASSVATPSQVHLECRSPASTWDTISDTYTWTNTSTTGSALGTVATDEDYMYDEVSTVRLVIDRRLSPKGSTYVALGGLDVTWYTWDTTW